MSVPQGPDGAHLGNVSGGQCVRGMGPGHMANSIAQNENLSSVLHRWVRKGVKSALQLPLLFADYCHGNTLAARAPQSLSFGYNDW